MAEIIEIQEDVDDNNWEPLVGDETSDLLRSIGFSDADTTVNETGERILDETCRIMAACGNPSTETNRDTGIVIGYVQSGKTLSFTTLTALSRDNDYQIVIVIAGTSVNLVNQSTDRLRRDLRLESRFDRKWTLLQNPSRIEDQETIETTLAQWADLTFPRDRCRTVLITVMKHGSHLRNLTDLLSELPLQGVPTLIIDDESDQASLNNRARWAARAGIGIEDLTENEVSVIYRRITGLRSIFPHHTFLQYTATPQANLFINIMDRLSPNFIKLLVPGSEYVGGVDFFQTNQNLVQEIPASDISTTNNPLSEPPESLIEALKIFYLGVVAGEMLRDQRNRSMLIHPSRLQGDQNTFYRWVNTIKDSWRRLLTSQDEEEKRHFLDEFRVAYDDLASTVNDLPSFEELTGHNLVHAITYTPIVEVNSRQGRTPQINWQDSYAWILVGGQSMDRGFTVEGLTVTYMPRNVGVGNVDTIQQRARFLGYKRCYLGYCRVFLDEDTIYAYNAIIQHEEDVRNRLEEFDINNRELDDWDREAVLDRMLGLTRPGVLYTAPDRDRFGENWFWIRAPHDTDDLILPNETAAVEFINEFREDFDVDVGHVDRTEDQKHQKAILRTRDVLEKLLNKVRFTRESDSATYSSLRGLLKAYLDENPDDMTVIYLMKAPNIDTWSIRDRRLTANDEIQQLFQGEQPTKDGKFRQGEVYPGDRSIKEEDRVSVQLHRVHLTDATGNNILDEFGNTQYSDVFTLAIWLPERLAVDIVRQG